MGSDLSEPRFGPMSSSASQNETDSCGSMKRYAPSCSNECSGYSGYLIELLGILLRLNEEEEHRPRLHACVLIWYYVHSLSPSDRAWCGGVAADV